MLTITPWDPAQFVRLNLLKYRNLRQAKAISIEFTLKKTAEVLRSAAVFAMNFIVFK